jgi:integrase
VRNPKNQGQCLDVPADRMKASKEHRVPLSAAALAIIETLRKDQGSTYLSGRQARQATQQYGPACAAAEDGAIGSDCARLSLDFRDWAAKCTNYPNEVVEMALAHTINSKVEAA